MRVVVIGAGVGGLTTALALARDGHEVTVVERDDTPMPGDVEGAFAWDRRGAPQVRHTHGFPALIRVMLRDHFPDVLAALLAAGVREVSVLPAAATPDLPGYEQHREDLQVLSCRRTTLEWVLRRTVLAETGVRFVVGRGVDGLVAAPAARGVQARPVPLEVRGVRLDDGSVVDADAVVAACGRRCAAPAWLAEHGVALPEEEHPTGTVYLSRFYRSDGAAAPMGYVGGRRIGVGFVLAGADNGTYSATLAIPTDDAELRAHVRDHFEAVLPLFKELRDAGRGTPITPVQIMGGLINRIRRFRSDSDVPLARRFFAVGDSHTCTNPLYGRGSSLAVLQAILLRDALRAGDDAERVYEDACADKIEPWYEMSLLADKPEAANLGAFDLQSMRRATASEDPEVAVLTTRMMSLLVTPVELFADEALVARLRAAGDPKPKPPPPRLLTREDLLSARG